MTTRKPPNHWCIAILLALLLQCSPSHAFFKLWGSGSSFSRNFFSRPAVLNINNHYHSTWKSRLFWKATTSTSTWKNKVKQILEEQCLQCRGGESSSSDSSEEEIEEESEEDTTYNANILKENNTVESVPIDEASSSQNKVDSSTQNKVEPTQSSQTTINPQARFFRHTSDMLQNLVARSAVVIPESIRHRQLIAQRSQDYLDDLMAKRREQQQEGANEQQRRPPKLPHPKKVLHYLAPKIPAIKHSPDVNLRIITARSDIDSGVAACLIGTLARVCEVYDREVLSQSRQQESKQQNGKPASSTSSSTSSAALALVKDRRFEQVVECLLCGVDVKKRKREYIEHFRDAKKRHDDDSNINDDIEDIIEGEQVQVQEGLNIRDACRAAWGLAILGAHHCGTLGGTRVVDLLMALSLRIRELLLSRLQMFLQGDLMEDLRVGDSEYPNWKPQTPEERLDELAEELAEDAAAAMWAFACVRACTGMRSFPLFETCSSILCQDPMDMRRRAQEANEDASVNDVVDRLFLSEAKMLEADKGKSTKNETRVESGSRKPVGKTTTGSENKDALIDWLSPNELTDVLWALALHGHSETSLLEETKLTMNAQVLKEVAFDRLMAFLHKDLEVVEIRKQLQESSTEMIDMNHSTEEVVTKEGEKVTVAVVDAAALLASENAAKAALVTTSDSPKAKTSSGGMVGNADDVEAAYEAIVGQSSRETVSPEVVKTAQSVLLEEGGEPGTVTVDMHTNDVENTSAVAAQEHNSASWSEMDLGSVTVSSHSDPEQLFFSPHDLCSLAWAVTELRDSLRFQIVNLVISIFSGLGEESFDELSGADLSNLAWACARHTNDARPWSSDDENPACLQLAIWVVRRALIASGGNIGENEQSQQIHILDPFQPPELSRLLWAVASLTDTFADKDDHFPDIEDLAMHALVSAGSNLSKFSPEDLVRIFWAFLEVCDLEDALSQPGVADALGRVFATIEASITRWERGHYNQHESEEDDGSPESRGGFGGFNGISSLFLRPSLSRQMLDQFIEENNGFDEEEEKVVSSMAGNGKKRLPRLRDLGIDPSTLVKAAGGFAKLTASHLNMRGSPILTRVTLKLLTSKNGRLLQEFSMCNLIRACEAAAINEAVGRGEDLIVGQFARRFLHLLNDANEPTDGDDRKTSSDLKLSSASPEEIATLVWSLGELGARHFVTDKEKQTAHRKLRLVVECPLLTDDQIQRLSTSSSLQTLHGLVALNTMRSDKTTLVKVLRLIEPKLPWIRSENDLCEIAESLAVIRQALAREAIYTQKQDIVNATGTATRDSKNEQKLDSNNTLAENNETLNARGNVSEIDDDTNVTGVLSEAEELQQSSSRMLSTIARYATERVANLRAGSLCRLLVVYSLLPFQADEFIDACEAEVATRQALLESASTTASVEDLLRQAAEQAVAANKTVFQSEDDSSSTMASLKKGLKSMFSTTTAEEKEISEEMQNFTNEIGGLLNRVTASVTKVDQCMEQIGVASNVHTDTALQRIMEGANFELGRCHELIDNYRLIEFSTGRRQSRYDYEQSRDIGKRLLSRLIPR